MPFAYDISKTYRQNYDHGPFLERAATPQAASAPTKAFLGLPVQSRLGISAGLLLNARWIGEYAHRGFDILTYKTVRSAFRASYPLPNWVFVEDSEGGADPEAPVFVVGEPAADPATISSAVCFGMPSMAPEVWRPDVAAAKRLLGPGQVLVVSVVATPPEDARPGDADRAVVADFVRCAAWAAEAGADVVEANLSCPNVCTGEGSLYRDPVSSGRIAAALRAALPGTPLLLKVGHFPDDAGMRAFLRAVAGSVSGIVLVNGITRPVLHRDGRPAFGERFRRAGVLGRALHGLSVGDVARAARIVGEDGLGLAIVAVGGISTAADIDEFLDAGAAAVMLGSSPMFGPDLAARLKAERPDV